MIPAQYILRTKNGYMKQKTTLLLYSTLTLAILLSFFFTHNITITALGLGLLLMGVVGGLNRKKLNLYIMKKGNLSNLNCYSILTTFVFNTFSKGFVLFLLILITFSKISTAQTSLVWTGPNGFTGNLGTRYLGDQIGSSGWNYTYYIGTGNQVNNVRVGITYNGSTWTYYGPGSYGPWTPSSNYSFTQDIGAFRCNQTGNCYVVGEALDNNTTNTWSIGGNNSWNQSAVFNSGNSAYFVVNALGNPTSCTVTIPANGTTATLGWTKYTGTAAYNVMIVRYAHGASVTAPTNGTGYALNASIGTGTVIYATNTGTSTTNTVTANTAYDYYFYSENWSYYSSGQLVTPTVSPIVTPNIGSYTYNGSSQGPNTATNSGTGSSYTYSYAGTGSTTYSASSTAPTSAGTYTVTSTVAASAPWTSASSSATAFTIGKVPLTITAANQSVCYGTAATTVTGAGTYTPTGFVNSETSSVIGGSATYTTTYTATTAGGTSGVTITPIVTSLTAANYSFSATTGTITVFALPTISGTLSICGSGTTTLTGSGSPAATTPWYSASTGVATVSTASSTTGTVTGVGAGTSNITYTDNHGCVSSVSTITDYSTTTFITPSATQNIPMTTNGTVLTVNEGTSSPASQQWWYETSSGSDSAAIAGQTGTTFTPNFASAGTYYIACKTVYGSPCSTTIKSSSVQINVTSNTITTGTITGSPFCAGASVSVPFTYSPYYPNTNFSSSTFVAQLSPDNTFASPVNISTSLSSDNSGSQTISATIPSNTASGTTYYIRVVSTASPVLLGAAYNSPLTVNALPSVTTATTTSVCSGTGPSITLAASPASTFTWTLGTNTGSIAGASASSGSSINQTLTNPSNTTAGSIVYSVVPTSTTGSCVGAATNITVTVEPAFTGGTLTSTTQTICNNTQPSSITYSTAPGGGTTPQYQWYYLAGNQTAPSGTFSIGSWTAIGSSSTSTATLNGSTIGSLSATTTYALRITDAGATACFDKWAGNAQVITVDAAFTSGAIATTGQTICSGGTPTSIGSTTVASGGDGSITYKWQSSLNGSTYSDISSTNSSTYTPPNGLTTTTYYRRQAEDGTCSGGFVSSTGVWLVTATPTPTTSNAGSTQTICSNSTATLAANIPSVGTGAWTIASGTSTSTAQFSSTSSNAATFTPVGAGTYTLTWTISNGTCTASSSNVIITVNQAITTDDASQSAYSSGWATSTGAITGFSNWTTLTTTGPGGTFIGSSTGNAGGASVSNINTSSKAWGMWNNGGLTQATRTFVNSTNTLPVSGTIGYSMDNGYVNTGDTVGVRIRNSSNNNLTELYFIGGNSNYTLNDSTSTTAGNTSVGWTGNGLDVSLARTGSSSYAIIIHRKENNVYDTVFSKFTHQSDGNYEPSNITFFNANAGTGSDYDAYFNSLMFGQPLITVEPLATQALCSSATATGLSVSAYGANLSYQWYSNGSTNSNSGGSSISGATSSTYLPPSTVGTNYYYCIVSNSCGGTTTTSKTAAVVVNASPSSFTLTPTSNCTNSTIVTSSSQSGSNYQLYDAIGTYGTYQAGTGSAITFSGLAVANGYYVIATNTTTGCTYTSSSTNITQAGVATFTATGTTICTTPGGNGVITTSTSTDPGVSYALYNTTSSISAQNGNNSTLSWSSLPAGTYHIIATNSSSCNLTVNGIVVGTYTNPSAPGVTNGSHCGTGTVNLSASGSSLLWYSNTGLTTQVTTGTSYTTPSLSSTTSYYVTQTDGNSCVSPYATVIATINTVPSAPTVGTITQPTCGTATGTVALSGLPSGTWTVTETVGSTTLNGSTTSSSFSGLNAGNTYTFTVTNSVGCISSASGNAIINAQPIAPSISSVSGTQTVCLNSTPTNLTVSATGTGLTYQWYSNTSNSNSGGSSISGATSSSYTPSTTAYGNIWYYVIVSGTCTSPATSSTVEVSVAVNTWTYGASTTSWTTGNNWSCGTVPASGANVVIATAAGYPILSGSSNDINNLTVNSSATLTVTGTLNVAGNISNSGTLDVTAGTLTLNGSSAQTVAGSFTVNNLNIANNVTLSSGTLSVIGVYTPTSGTLTTNGNLVLVSNSTATASVAAGSGSYISGAVTVQRYHSSKRAWMMLTAPLTTNGLSTTTYPGDIYSNWQADTYITGPSTATDGLDAGTNTAYGIKYYSGTAWVNGFPSMGSSYTTTHINSLFGSDPSGSDIKTFSLFVRGDRTIAPSSGSSSHSAVTLHAVGSLLTGHITQTIGTTMGNYSMVGNPYAAPVSLNALRTDNHGLTPIFYYWDPNLGGSTGGYVTASYSDLTGWTCIPGSNYTPIVQSGDAFFVRDTTGVSTLNFYETEKSTDSSTNAVFGTITPMSIKVDLRKGPSSYLVDGVATLYNNGYSAAVVPGEDAVKFWGNEENIAIIRSGSYLSIEERPVVALADTTFLYMYNMVAGNTYNFVITGTNMPTSTTGYLVDTYLGTQTPLNLTSGNNISFAVTTVAGSKAANRFMIVFSNTNPLSVDGMQIKASVKAKAAIVNWSVVTEKNVNHYEVERSTDGTTFGTIATQVAHNVNNSSYTYTDNQAANGANYYRIKAISNDGTVQYSSVAKVTIGDSKEGFSVYPNPIVGKEVNMILNNIEAGNYAVTMYNAAGQQVMEHNLAHAGGSVTTTVDLPSNLPTGVYQLRLIGNGKNYVETVIVK